MKNKNLLIVISFILLNFSACTNLKNIYGEEIKGEEIKLKEEKIEKIENIKSDDLDSKKELLETEVVVEQEVIEQEKIEKVDEVKAVTENNNEDIIEEKNKPIIYDETILNDLKSITSEESNEKYQKQTSNYYADVFFKNWHNTDIENSKEIVEYFIDKFSKKKLFGENKLERNSEFIDKISRNIDIESFPNSDLKGISLRRTSIRLLPESKPAYYDFLLPGEGFPFDNFQGCTLWPATPVSIIHTSKDKEWLYIKSCISEGWVHSKDIAFVDDEFIKEWETGEYLTLISEDITIKDENDLFRYKAGIGSFFPVSKSETIKTVTDLESLVIEENQIESTMEKTIELDENADTKSSEEANTVTILVVVEDKFKNAVINKLEISKSDVAIKPLKMDKENAVTIIKKLNNQNYGWGGLYGNRDCSGLTRDYFTVFGLMIPKYSFDQYKEGNYVDISDLSDENKKSFIIKNAVPFFTLLYKRGHVMLYLGHREDDIIIFHDIWGLRTTNEAGEEGREIIGRSIISSLELDKNMNNVKSKMLNSILGMTTFKPASFERKLVDFLDNN